MKLEIWKDIENFEGYYQISNYGNIRSVERVVKHPVSKNNKIKSKQKSVFRKKNSYIQVNLYKNSKVTGIVLHRLVAKAFIPNPENKPQVNHKNGNKLDNKVENLEWVTSKENIHHSIKTGLRKKRTGTYYSLTSKQLEEIHDLFGKIQQKQIALKYNVSEATISKIKNKINE
jgi:hypothetical protein